ncbi:MAG: AcrR family transcriptional regulator [Psychromonas sp.]|jgi:AcrR family transcriptional regulator|uniref:TetR/AcrR family transcriptional regulator n=1 Tax=Psychromonas sp. TaxID=1884585 RepID=UPI0039E55F20
MPTKKPKLSGKTTNRRNPSQIRSKERVEKILLTVKTLIEQNGISNLKIGDIANHAGVSPSSIYQYFSDKETIIIALAEHYMVQISSLIEKNLDKLEEHARVEDVIRQNFYDIYELHQRERALHEIWFESVDPKLNQLAFQDTQKNAQLILARIEPFAKQGMSKELGEFVLLASHQFAATMRLSLAMGEECGTDFIEMHCKMVTRALSDYIIADIL